jgi:hypothetical protein
MASINKRLGALVLALVCPLACGEAERLEPQIASGGRASGTGGAMAFGGASLGGEAGAMTASGGVSADAGMGGISSGGSAFGGSTTSMPEGSGGTRAFGGQSSVGNGGISEPSAGMPNVPEPELCARLGNTFPTPAGQVAWAYTTALLADCRLSGFYNSLTIPERAAAVNGVNTFSQELWGCLENEASGFALAMGASKLSRADSELLISDYLDAATVYVDLSRRERIKLSATLDSLAASAINVQSDEFTHSECVSSPGGAGGAGGSGGVSAGAGGAGQSGSGGAE